MRLTVMSQMTKGLRAANGAKTVALSDDEDQEDRASPQEITKELESLKWHLWHGNVYKALQVAEDLEWAVEGWREVSENGPKLLRAVREFYGYIAANAAFIPNYGDRYRHGERIATGFVESTVNQVVSKRMVKKQQMRWGKSGAHLLLQIRTRVLNNEWRETFSHWYPGMKATGDSEALLDLAA